LDANGVEIGWSSAKLPVWREGVYIAQLSFDGFDINKHGVNGPYTLDDLTIFNTTGSGGEIFSRPFTTAAYQATMFEAGTAGLYLSGQVLSPGQIDYKNI
jgi:hypothetical protein